MFVDYKSKYLHHVSRNDTIINKMFNLYKNDILYFIKSNVQQQDLKTDTSSAKESMFFQVVCVLRETILKQPIVLFQ
jgi:hypothetical protein